MLAVRGKNDLLILVRPVRADGMQSKLIVNGIVEDQPQIVERNDAPQRACQRVAKSLQIAVAGDRLGKIEKRFVNYRIRGSHIEDAIRWCRERQ